MGRGSDQSKGTVHKGKGSQGGQSRWNIKGGKRGKGGQGRQGQRASPDGGVSPPEEQAQRRVGGRSLLEGGWRMVPLPDDRVLKVRVPFLGNALCRDGETWKTLKTSWDDRFQVAINLRGRQSTGHRWVGSSIARELAIIGPNYDSVKAAFDCMMERAEQLGLPDVSEIAPPDMWRQDRETKQETRTKEDDPSQNLPRPDNEARLRQEQFSPDWDPDDALPLVSSSLEKVFGGRVVKLLTGGWKYLGSAIKDSPELIDISQSDDAPQVDQFARALHCAGIHVDHIWNCGLGDDEEHPSHLGFAAENVERIFACEHHIQEQLAIVLRLLTNTDSDSPLRIFFLSRKGLRRSLATAFIVQLAFKDPFGKQQGRCINRAGR